LHTATIRVQSDSSEGLQIRKEEKCTAQTIVETVIKEVDYDSLDMLSNDDFDWLNRYVIMNRCNWIDGMF